MDHFGLTGSAVSAGGVWAEAMWALAKHLEQSPYDMVGGKIGAEQSTLYQSAHTSTNPHSMMRDSFLPAQTLAGGVNGPQKAIKVSIKSLLGGGLICRESL